jgi:hypothetical protein
LIGDVAAAVGLLAAATAAAAALVLEPSPRRSAALLLGLALIPVLIVADQWNSAEISDLRDSPARFVIAALLALLLVAALAELFRRRPLLVPLAIVAALPFRVPLEAGGESANLLVPLYLVIAAGVVAAAIRDRDGHGGLRASWLPKALALALVAYALQALYSEDFSTALQNTAFFYVPFALAFSLLSDCRWDRRLLGAALAVAGAEALAFALVGFWEYGVRELIWNDEVIRSNEFHTYFRVNSLFWDPNVYGRYLALVITALVAVMVWQRHPRVVLALGALAGVLWLAMVITFSQSSFAALLAGLAALAALRWSLRWTLAGCGAILVGAVVFVLAAGGSLKIDLSTEHKVNKDTAGRANLVTGGLELFGDRPLWGYGSGSFSEAFEEHQGKRRTTVSHTEPITVAAERGVIGLAVYVAVLAAAFATLLRGMAREMPGLRGPPATETAWRPLGRAAVLACFIALLVHTMAYAGFLDDPLTWALLAIGGSLAAP